MSSFMTTAIQVYGTDWCRLTFSIREYLTNSRVDYDYFDIDCDPAGDEFVRMMHNGRRRYPVVVLEEQVVTNPTLTELEKLLRDHRVESRPRAHTPQTRDRKGNRRG
jgi:glutaredoxin